MTTNTVTTKKPIDVWVNNIRYGRALPPGTYSVLAQNTRDMVIALPPEGTRGIIQLADL